MRPGIFVSRTREKFGRTLEPCICTFSCTSVFFINIYYPQYTVLHILSHCTSYTFYFIICSLFHSHLYLYIYSLVLCFIVLLLMLFYFLFYYYYFIFFALSIERTCPVTFHYWLYPVWLCMWQIIKNLEPLNLDLSVVLQGLSTHPFEPLETVTEKVLTVKTVLLLALSSLKRVGDLQALSISPSCMDFAPRLVKVLLRLRPDYVPKVTSNPFHFQQVVLEALSPMEAGS